MSAKKDNSKINVEYEVSATTQRVAADVDVPSETVNTLADATANFVNTLTNCSEKVVNMLCNGGSILAAPVGALLRGKAAEFELANQSIYAKLAMTKEVNMRRHASYVAQELDAMVLNGEIIPDRLDDTDNLLLIQENASTTSNEDFLKLWAKLYTCEACKPGSVSRKTIKIIETLDADIVRVLEENIFPFCDSNGIYWGSKENISDLLLAMDYNLMQDGSVCVNPKDINQSLAVFIDDEHILRCHPNYGYSANYNHQMYRLTTPGLEVYNNLNKTAKTQENLATIFTNVLQSSVNWEMSPNLRNKIKLKNENGWAIKKFVICDSDGNVIYPKDSQFKTYDEFYNKSLENIEVLENN